MIRENGKCIMKKLFPARFSKKAKMETTLKILSVAIGGALGAVARYLINISPLARLFEKFPLPTLMKNVGSGNLPNKPASGETFIK